MTDVPRETPAPEWRVPLCYTREELATFLSALRAGQYRNLLFARHESGGDRYVVARGRGHSLRFNRLRTVDDPQHARDLATILTTWADLQEADV